LAGFFARNGELAEDWVDYFSEFDLIISFLYDPDEIFKTNIKRCTRAQFIAGPHRPDETLELHAAEVFLKPLEQLAIFQPDATPRLAVEKAFETTIGTGRWLAAHPGSGSESKNWPETKWLELLQQVMESTTLRLLLVGGEAERERLEWLARALPATRLKLMLNAPLPEVAQWLAACVAFVGHDSGISHLAAAVEVPSLLLWGETDETVWRPRAREMTMLRDAKGLEQLSVPVVMHHLEELLNRGDI
jgi:heptosyltransferase III